MEFTLTHPGTVSLKTKGALATVLLANQLEKPAKSDIVLLTTQENVDGKKQSINTDFLVDSPGEYEYGGMAILGVDEMHSVHERVSYRVSAGGYNAVFLDRSVSTLDDDSLEAFGRIDILFLVIGSEAVLNPGTATKLVRSCEPTYLIPIPETKSDNSIIDEWLKKDFATNEIIEDKNFKLKPNDTNELFKIVKLY